MPGNPILLLEADPSAGDEIRATLTRSGYTVATALDVEGAIRLAPNHQMVIIDAVAAPMTGPDACRALRAAATSATKPLLCISRTDDVEERIALPRGRSGRRHGPAVRCPRARGAGRGARGPVPAHTGHVAAHRAGAGGAPREPGGGGLQPEGRRRDDDDRGQRGDGRSSASPQPDAADRPRPAVRPGHHPPEPAAQPFPGGPRPRRGSPPRPRACCGPTSRPTRAGCRSSARPVRRNWRSS